MINGHISAITLFSDKIIWLICSQAINNHIPLLLFSTTVFRYRAWTISDRLSLSNGIVRRINNIIVYFSIFAIPNGWRVKAFNKENFSLVNHFPNGSTKKTAKNLNVKINAHKWMFFIVKCLRSKKAVKQMTEHAHQFPKHLRLFFVLCCCGCCCLHAFNFLEWYLFFFFIWMGFLSN